MNFSGFLKNFTFVRFIFLFILFFPKVPIFSISGLQQGLRIEDLLCLFYGLYLVVSRKIYSIKYFKFIVIVLIYLTVIGLISEINEISQNWIILIRLLEYIIIIKIISTQVNDENFIKNTLIWYIIINTAIAILQYKGVVGAFASFTYLPPGSGWLERPYGLTGGPWELGLTLIFALFTILMVGTSYRIYSLFFINLCVIICLILSATRANIVAYLVGLIFFYKNKFKSIKKVLYILILLGISLLLLDNFNITNRFTDIIDKTKNINEVNLSNFRTYFILDASITNRLLHWSEPYELWSKNYLYTLFGIGWHNLYMESLVLRIIFTFGIIGTIYFAVSARKMPAYILLIVLISGLTLDIFLSQKIFFTFSLLYLMHVKKFDNEV